MKKHSKLTRTDLYTKKTKWTNEESTRFINVVNNWAVKNKKTKKQRNKETKKQRNKLMCSIITDQGNNDNSWEMKFTVLYFYK
jgi:hypothetical protein